MANRKKSGQDQSSYNRIIVKLGTSLLTGGTDHLDRETMSGLVNQMANLHSQGVEILVVSSGAIAAGRHKLGRVRDRRGIPYRQVLASIGQGQLMNIYDQLFSESGITVAQALLSKSDLTDRAGYLNARNTLLALLELKVICIVNENDVVSIDEIKEEKFGDNDNLSAMVANLVDADLLLILSDIAGLYTADPHRDATASLIPQVDKIDSRVTKLVKGTAGSLGTGGMLTKIEAARLATSSGVAVVIADGREPDIISRIAAGEKIGTLFTPVAGSLESRKRWMMSGLSTKGKLTVDPGAAEALKKQNRSLLAAGITQTEGKFQRGDIVNIYDPEEIHIGCGITNYSTTDIAAIKGIHSKSIADTLGYDYGSEVVHRNNLVIL
ncbi:MAG: glutamate 5-kinase [Chloroflexi bacterium RBG_13_46_14]|nr:MAG: glutamate 5-kinase [Chloroflexi bacterium RBG_13_46_14]